MQEWVLNKARGKEIKEEAVEQIEKPSIERKIYPLERINERIILFDQEVGGKRKYWEATNYFGRNMIARYEKD